MNATTGAETLIGAVDHQAKGLAFIGATLYSVAARSDLLRTINPVTAATSSSIPITLAGFPIFGALGLATRPEDNLLFAILKTSTGTPGSRRLVTIDETSGVATDIGALSTGYAGLAFASPDSDGDGFPDDVDACVYSDLSATVVIDGCDSGVANALDATGCTIADGVGQCAADATNHGGFVSCVAHLTNGLKDAGTISGREKGAIERCAAQADLP